MMKKLYSLGIILLVLFMTTALALATVSDSTSRIKYGANGNTTTFDFFFGVNATGDIQVIYTDATDVELILTETTHYEITATNNDYSSGGTVTTVATYASGTYITIVRNVTIEQESDFTEGMPTLYEVFEDGLDDLTRIAQQHDEEITRTPKLAVSSPYAATGYTFPDPEAGKVVGWNSGGTDLTLFSPGSGDTIDIADTIVLISDHSNNIATAVTAIGATETTLLIDVAVPGDTTTPSTLILWFVGGGSLTGTVEISSPAHITARPSQAIFSNTATITFTNGGTVSPNWFKKNILPETTVMHTAIQKAIDSLPKGTVSFLPESYLYTANVTGKTGVNLKGNGATLTFTDTWEFLGSFFDIDDVDNITIEGFIFDGQGVWTSDAFPYPYGSGDKYGFTNDQIGISNRFSTSSNIVIKNNTFKRLGRAGIRLTGGGSVLKILNNDFYDYGRAGVVIYDYEEFVITGNTFTGGQGGMKPAADESHNGDGMYIYNSNHGVVSNNTITDMIRMGMIFEGLPNIEYNSWITISGNTITNIHSSRFNETNAAIWFESEEADHTSIIIGNTLDNTGVPHQSLREYYSPPTLSPPTQGIQANKVLVTNNVIRDFGTGIKGQGYVATGNTVMYNTAGVWVYEQDTPAGWIENIATIMTNNWIALNDNSGIVVAADADGLVIIKGNTILDNGQDPDEDYYKSGILIAGYVADVEYWIDNNTFISSADEGDTEGQLYAIVGRAGGPINYTTKRIINNTFTFTGTFTTDYPDSLAVTPTSFGYAHGGVVDADLEIGPDNLGQNVNSKFMESYYDDIAVSSNYGLPILIGKLDASPTSGNYKQGEFFLNRNPASGEYFGWIVVLSERSPADGGEPATETVWAVDDAQNATTSDKIGVELDNGNMHWTVISSVSSNNITVSSGVPAGRTISDNAVIKWFRPKGWGAIE